jgi:hypothetical protein
LLSPRSKAGEIVVEIRMKKIPENNQPLWPAGLKYARKPVESVFSGIARQINSGPAEMFNFSQMDIGNEQCFFLCPFGKATGMQAQALPGNLNIVETAGTVSLLFRH